MRTILLTAWLATTAHAAAPDLPCLSGMTFDEAVERGKPANTLILLLDNGINEDAWRMTAWADPELAEWLKNRGWTVVHMSTQDEPALTWMLRPDRTPAMIMLGASGERVRRYGASSRETPEFMIDWFERVIRGSTLADDLASELLTQPADIKKRYELIQELNRTGRTAEMWAQICWLIDHNQIAADGLDRPESEVRRSLLFMIGGMREAFGLWPSDGQDGWERARSLADLNLDQLNGVRSVVDLRETLEARLADGTASQRDRFLLDGLTADGEAFQAMMPPTPTDDAPPP